MDTRKITKYVIISTILLWIGWDIYAFIEPAPNDTESEVIVSWAHQFASFAFSFGAVCGHWFWPGERIPHGHFILAGVAVIHALLEFFLVITVNPAFPFLGGFVCGHFLWGQDVPSSSK